jgi:transcriptional regulator with XRE-family HTH domain
MHANNEDNKIIGSRIHEMRLAKGLSLAEVAEAIGYKGKTGLSKIESGKQNITRNKLILLSDYFGVELSYFLDGTKLGKTFLPEMERYKANMKNPSSFEDFILERRLNNFVDEDEQERVSCNISPEDFKKYQDQIIDILKAGEFKLGFDMGNDLSDMNNLRLKSTVSDKELVLRIDVFQKVFFSDKVLQFMTDNNIKAKVF